MIAPLLDELASEYDARVRIGKVNIDEEQALAAQYGIRAIPTLLFFKNGEVSAQIVGMCSKRDLKSNIDKLLGIGLELPCLAAAHATDRHSPATESTR